ncbi:hypothetical protein BZG36_04383 [Bifiguratus adelaidae]|uniref:Uncharacterized protein n=1 Tax=Bifiguratus adelaidae TaxID=1938954 RepID=A0A261XVG7_9FUNG|nr:hypothetical protein BZG36_04383 [Bifiguratus adelaidae]
MKRDVVGILRDFQRVAEKELNLKNKDGSLFPISSSNLLRYLRYIRFSAKNLSRVISALSTHHSHGPTWKQNINNNPDIMEYLFSRTRNDTSPSQSMKVKDLLRPEFSAHNGSMTQRPGLDTPFGTKPLKPNGFPQVAKKSTTPFIIPVHLEKSKLRQPIRREKTPKSVSPTMSIATSDNKTVTARDESPSSSPFRSSEPIATSIKRARYSEAPLEQVSKRARQDSPDPIEVQISTSPGSAARRNLRPRKQQNYSPTSNRHQIIDDLSDFVTVSLKKGTKGDVNHARVEIANTVVYTDSDVDKLYETIEEIEKRYLDNCEHHQYCAIYGNWHLPLKPSLIFLWATEILSPRGRATIEDPPHLPLFMDQSNWQHILDTTPSNYEFEDANPSSQTSQLESVKLTSSSTKSHISTSQRSPSSSQTSVKSDLQVKKEAADNANLLSLYPPIIQANSTAQKSASIRPSASPQYPKSLLWLARKSTT